MEMPENKIEERRSYDGFDFVAGIKVVEFLKELGEHPYETKLRFDVSEVISNLSRTLARNLDNMSKKEIEECVDSALSGESSSLTPIRLPEEKRQLARELILKKIEDFIK